MVNIKNPLSRLKANIRNKIKNNTVNIKTDVLKFKQKIFEAASRPKSKRKSFLVGFTTIFGIFSFVSILPAIAKDNIPTPTKSGVSPAPTPKPGVLSSTQIISGLSGAAASICALAVSSGSFAIGSACGLVVVIGILKAQGQ